MNILAIIPARGGSKRLPNKNIRTFRGKPLITHTIEQAKESKYLSRIIVSTDDSQIASIARQYNTEVLIRPPYLSQGEDGSMIRTIKHVIEHLDKYEGYKPDTVVILQPTSPLRTTIDIDNAIKLLLDTGAESVDSRCNDKQNGAVYVFRRYILMEHDRGFIGTNHRVYEMPEERSIDIDTEEDFIRAEGTNVDSRMLHELDRLKNGKGDDKKRKGKRGKSR